MMNFEERKRVADLLAKTATRINQIMTDYQFDPEDEDYCGFLNIDPRDNWEDQMIVSNKEIFESIFNLAGFTIQSAHDTEMIIELIKEE